MKDLCTGMRRDAHRRSRSKEQLGKEGKRLGRIGEEMGKPIGARLKQQIEGRQARQGAVDDG